MMRFVFKNQTTFCHFLELFVVYQMFWKVLSLVRSNKCCGPIWNLNMVCSELHFWHAFKICGNQNCNDFAKFPNQLPSFHHSKNPRFCWKSTSSCHFLSKPRPSTTTPHRESFSGYQVTTPKMMAEPTWNSSPAERYLFFKGCHFFLKNN